MQKGRLAAERGGSQFLSLAQVAAAEAAKGGLLEVESYLQATETPRRGRVHRLRRRSTRRHRDRPSPFAQAGHGS